MKSKMFKRTLAMAMVSAMALSTTAFAADGEMTAGDDGYPTQEITVAGELAEAIIKVTFPTDPKVIINPYGMDVNITEKITSNAQVLSPTYALVNESNVDLAVSVKALGTVGGDKATLVETADEVGEDGDKKLFMYVEMASATKEDASDAVWAESYTDAANQLIIPAEEMEDGKELLKMPKADYKSGALSKAKYAAFKMGGKATTNPDEAWADTDTVSVNLTFSFKPTTIEATPAG